MSCITQLAKRLIRRIIIFLQHPIVYIFISYVLLFLTFLMEIYDIYKYNFELNSYQYCDFFVTPNYLY